MKSMLFTVLVLGLTSVPVVIDGMKLKVRMGNPEYQHPGDAVLNQYSTDWSILPVKGWGFMNVDPMQTKGSSGNIAPMETTWAVSGFGDSLRTADDAAVGVDVLVVKGAPCGAVVDVAPFDAQSQSSYPEVSPPTHSFGSSRGTADIVERGLALAVASDIYGALRQGTPRLARGGFRASVNYGDRFLETAGAA